jgi:hypothetical protein
LKRIDASYFQFITVCLAAASLMSGGCRESDNKMPSSQSAASDTSAASLVENLRKGSDPWKALPKVPGQTDPQSENTSADRSQTRVFFDDTPPNAPSDLLATVEKGDDARMNIVNVWASSSVGAETSASSAVDGDLNTSWISAASEDGRDETLTLDLDVEADIDSVRLSMGSPDLFIYNVEIWAGLDNEEWVLVRDAEDLSEANSATVTLGFKPTKARYVRIVSFDPKLSSQSPGLYVTGAAEIDVFSTTSNQENVLLSFTAPGDDRLQGTADRYEVYQGVSPFDESSLNTAALLLESPSPVEAGLSQSIVVSHLVGNTDYYFAVRAVDEANNKGPLSEVARVRTSKQRPAELADLSVETIGATEVVLSVAVPSSSVSQPGLKDSEPVTTEDPTSVSKVEIRRAAFPMFEENFSMGEIVSETEGSTAAVAPIQITVTDLTPGTAVYFAAVTIDAEGSSSYVSENIRVETETPTEVSSECGNGKCEEEETLDNCAKDCNLTLSIIVEASLVSSIEASLSQYQSDLAKENQSAEIVVWNGGSADELRSLISEEKTLHAVKGAWLIGNLPAAWYEQTAFDAHEEFPLDLYFMDLDATWEDADQNGIFDSHSDLTLDLYVSRLTGDAADIQAYFDKAHQYRENGSITEVSAYIFKDDDWKTFHEGSTWGLDAVYSSIETCETSECTTRDGYINKLSAGSAEFVYQWIHSDPTHLSVTGTGNGLITVNDLAATDFNGAFYNLFDCSAARFTQTNIAMSYLTKTDSGLAVIGSTKTGGIYTPTQFHSALATGNTWGDAYVNWYNQNGKSNDEWYMGIVILGDPLLFLVEPASPIPAAYRRLPAVQEETFSKEEIEALAHTMSRIAKTVPLRTFKDYRNDHPEFFQKTRPSR